MGPFYAGGDSIVRGCVSYAGVRIVRSMIWLMLLGSVFESKWEAWSVIERSGIGREGLNIL